MRSLLTSSLHSKKNKNSGTWASALSCLLIAACLCASGLTHAFNKAPPPAPRAAQPAGAASPAAAHTAPLRAAQLASSLAAPLLPLLSAGRGARASPHRVLAAAVLSGTGGAAARRLGDAPLPRRTLKNQLSNSTTVFLDFSRKGEPLTGSYSGTRVQLDANLRDPTSLGVQIAKARRRARPPARPHPAPVCLF